MPTDSKAGPRGIWMSFAQQLYLVSLGKWQASIAHEGKAGWLVDAPYSRQGADKDHADGRSCHFVERSGIRGLKSTNQ